MRRMLREVLSIAGYRVWEAGDGSEALERWARDIEKIDLVVTDVVMPTMNGLRLVEELRKIRPGIKILCMTGHSEDVFARQTGPDALLDLLRKPFKPDVLVRKVREILKPSGAPRTVLGRGERVD